MCYRGGGDSPPGVGGNRNASPRRNAPTTATNRRSNRTTNATVADAPKVASRYAPVPARDTTITADTTISNFREREVGIIIMVPRNVSLRNYGWMCPFLGLRLRRTAPVA